MALCIIISGYWGCYFCFLQGKVKYSDSDIHDGWLLREKVEKFC